MQGPHDAPVHNGQRCQTAARPADQAASAEVSYKPVRLPVT